MAQIPTLDHDMVRSYLVRLPGWSLKEDPDRIERAYTFDDERTAQDFAARVEALCRRERYEGAIRQDGLLCTVGFRNTLVNGLHEIDFAMAAMVDGVADGPYVPASASMDDVSPTARQA